MRFTPRLTRAPGLPWEAQGAERCPEGVTADRKGRPGPAPCGPQAVIARLCPSRRAAPRPFRKRGNEAALCGQGGRQRRPSTPLRLRAAPVPCSAPRRAPRGLAPLPPGRADAGTSPPPRPSRGISLRQDSYANGGRAPLQGGVELARPRPPGLPPACGGRGRTSDQVGCGRLGGTRCSQVGAWAAPQGGVLALSRLDVGRLGLGARSDRLSSS